MKLEGYLIKEFPNTEAGIWFEKSSGGKNARGKLYDAYNEWKHKLRSANLRSAEKGGPVPKRQCTEADNRNNI